MLLELSLPQSIQSTATPPHGKLPMMAHIGHVSSAIEHIVEKFIGNIDYRYNENKPTVCENQDEALLQAWDDVTGKELDSGKVVKARNEEVAYIHKSKLYTKVPRSKAKGLGAKVISVRWTDINNGDIECPNYRSRLVARETKRDNRPDLFAATPPLEAMKVLLSLLSSSNKGEKLMVNDVSRAYFSAPATRQVFVELPQEDKSDGDDLIGELNYSMYGTRDAALNWGEECASTMTELGYERGKASPCTFYHPARQLRTYIHGDDFVTIGKEEDLAWLKQGLEKHYEIKTEVLGPSDKDKQQVKVLNRIITWTDTGIEYEADPRHVELILKELHLKDAKGVCSPGTKEDGTTKPDKDDLLLYVQAKEYLSLVARLNYLAPDRADIAYSVKELARTMSKPTKGCWEKLKRLGRYFISQPRLIIRYPWQDVPRILKVYSDADWAGCKTTRKSTSGGCIMMGEHLVKSWSKTQSLTALSSGESEFYAALKASAEGLGMLSLLKDYGLVMRGQVFGDASAALGIINRKGLGRTRHIDTGLLWIQETAAAKRSQFTKVLGTINPADLMTKYLTRDVLMGHCERINLIYKEGRAHAAPKLNMVLKAIFDYDFDSKECQPSYPIEPQHDEDDEGGMLQLQSTINQVWHKTWKGLCHAIIIKAVSGHGSIVENAK